MPNARAANKLIVGAYLEDELVGKLRFAAEKDKRTQADILTEAIEDWLARWERRNRAIGEKEWQRAAEALRRR